MKAFAILFLSVSPLVKRTRTHARAHTHTPPLHLFEEGVTTTYTKFFFELSGALVLILPNITAICLDKYHGDFQ